MKAISLMYHDVINSANFDSSGFPGQDSSRYKLEPDEFKQHLEAIAKATGARPVSVYKLLGGTSPVSPLLLTFDDGGASAYTYIAPMLENFGWRGHFFISSYYIDKPFFLSRKEILELKKRGHLIGSHSFSHPTRMASLSSSEQIKEWKRSSQDLSVILGEAVEIASLPGGYYSRQVAKAAALAGIKALFTSEPTSHCNFVNDCLVLGRYHASRGMPAQLAAAVAVGKFLPCFRQSFFWNLKKVIKFFLRDLYLQIRRKYLGNGEGNKLET
jgi:peptidoglycan/xylan/chitin deacetylase (PgdA/CDA1 family)